MKNKKAGREEFPLPIISRIGLCRETVELALEQFVPKPHLTGPLDDVQDLGFVVPGLGVLFCRIHQNGVPNHLLKPLL